MSIKALAWMVRAFPPPVYCFHEIVHNQVVVDEFEALGVRFIDDVSDAPEGAPLMLSAHGSAPHVLEHARSRSPYVVDTACPLVTKVHQEVARRARENYTIVYLGERHHDEAEGTLAVAPDAITIVTDPEDVSRLPETNQPVALLSQTTLPFGKWLEVREQLEKRYGSVWVPPTNDLCYATTNRQAAVEALVPLCDAIIVVGSENSSNTKSLVEVARAAGAERVYRVNSPYELPTDIGGVVGITAGASAPNSSVEEIIAFLAPVNGIELVSIGSEDEYFPPPRDLRRLLRDFPGLIPYDFDHDRETTASAVLSELRNLG